MNVQLAVKVSWEKLALARTEMSAVVLLIAERVHALILMDLIRAIVTTVTK